MFGSLGNFAGAIREFQTALRLDPNYAEAHNNLGNTFAAIGQLDKAIHHYQAALEIVPDYADGRRNLTLTERAKSQNP